MTQVKGILNTRGNVPCIYFFSQLAFSDNEFRKRHKLLKSRYTIFCVHVSSPFAYVHVMCKLTTTDQTQPNRKRTPGVFPLLG
jgi:hypothetical protein